jgi:hypothetical protein
MNIRADARKLFIPAALFNFFTAASFLVFFPLAARLMQFDPALDGSVFVQISGGAVLLFGWMYWQIARDPVRNRNYIVSGIIGKLCVVAIVYGDYLTGRIAWPLAALVSGDVIFSALFWRFLRRHPAS